MKADTRLMKQLNKSTLRNILSQKRTATKPELAKYSGLSVVTVNALLSEMLYKRALPRRASLHAVPL